MLKKEKNYTKKIDQENHDFILKAFYMTIFEYKSMQSDIYFST